MKTKLPGISYEVTSSCNLNCRYCYNHWKCNDSSPRSSNSYKEALRTLKKLMQLADFNQVSFTGGEPLMAERFSELVLYARMKGRQVAVISNGNFGGFREYENLVKLGVALFELPVHSCFPECHDYLTGTAGSWLRSTEIIRGLMLQKTDVVAVIVLTRVNCLEIEKTISFIRSLGITRIMLNRFNLGGQGLQEMKNLLMSAGELNAAFSKASDMAIKLKLSISSNVCTPICILDPDKYSGIRFSFCSSDFTRRPLTLDILGNLRFCNHSPVELGNIFKNTLEEILTSFGAEAWKNTIPGFCKDCKAYYRCQGGCRAASEQMGYGLDHPDPLLDFTLPDEVELSRLKS
ncbi:MAG: radical SAM protein [Bacteroidales bacterium]